jgi:protein-S-isoprenylcysteine O-methyltransferase Ste14
VLYLDSPLVTAYAPAGTIGWDLFVRAWEEYDLEQRFGEPYARYRDAVRCRLPRMRGYGGEGMERQ